MIPSENTTLRAAGRGLARMHWTSVATTAGVGVVLVALAARLGGTAAAVMAFVAGSAVLAAAWRAIIEDRRWRRALSIVQQDVVPGARRSSTRRSA